MECFGPESVVTCICCYYDKGGCSSHLLNRMFEDKEFEECKSCEKDCKKCGAKSSCSCLKEQSIRK